MLKFIIGVTLTVTVLLNGFLNGAHADESAKPEVIQSELSFQTCEGGLYVSVIGKIRNVSPKLLDSIALDVQFFDSAGQLIDAANEDAYDIVVPANGEAPFKIRTSATAEQSKYASHLVRIVRFHEDVTRTPPSPQKSQPQSKNVLDKYITLWIPIFILILVLVVITYGRKSPQTRMVSLVEKQIQTQTRMADFVEKQVKLLESQNAILDRIANAAERKSDGQDSTY